MLVFSCLRDKRLFCQACAMTQVAHRKTIFVLETVFSLFFLSLCSLALHLPLRVFECSMNHGQFKGLTMPEITRCLEWCLPEEVWSAIVGTIALAVGFASVASVSQDALSSRLFRWFLIPLGFAIFAAILPLAESRMCLCSKNQDAVWLDEILFLAFCLALGYAGWRYARKTYLPYRSSDSQSD